MTLLDDIKAGFLAVAKDIKKIFAALGADDKPIAAYPDGRSKDIYSVLQWLSDVTVPIFDNLPPDAQRLFSSEKVAAEDKALLAQVLGIGLYVPLAVRCENALSALSWEEEGDAAILTAAGEAVAALKVKLAGFVTDEQQAALTGIVVTLEAVAAKEAYDASDREEVQAQTVALNVLAGELSGDTGLYGAESLRAVGLALTAKQVLLDGLRTDLDVMIQDAVKQAALNTMQEAIENYVDERMGFVAGLSDPDMQDKVWEVEYALINIRGKATGNDALIANLDVMRAEIGALSFSSKLRGAFSEEVRADLYAKADAIIALGEATTLDEAFVVDLNTKYEAFVTAFNALTTANKNYESMMALDELAYNAVIDIKIENSKLYVKKFKRAVGFEFVGSV